LSNISPSQFAMAVIADDVNLLKKLPGVGAKTAQRIILELKDKIKTDDAITSDNNSKVLNKLNENAQDAVDALQVLGYSKKDIEKVIEKENLSDMSTEDIIKLGLKNLSR
jgi:Holliday junction DNA helicase RuvA